MSKPSNYQEHLLTKLQDRKKAVAYLNEALDDNAQLFLIALRNVIKSEGRDSRLVQKSKLNRETLSKTFSRQTSLTLENLILILKTLGFKLKVKDSM